MKLSTPATIDQRRTKTTRYRSRWFQVWAEPEPTGEAGLDKARPQPPRYKSYQKKHADADFPNCQKPRQGSVSHRTRWLDHRAPPAAARLQLSRQERPADSRPARRSSGWRGSAVPPAYVDVVYANDESAPLQAMGRDAAGRWQYRYHPDWEKVRERRKSRHLVRLIEALPRIRRHVTGVLATRKPTRRIRDGRGDRADRCDRHPLRHVAARAAVGRAGRGHAVEIQRRDQRAVRSR